MSGINLKPKKAVTSLRFECQKCGNCCSCEGYVFVSKADYQRLLDSKRFTKKELAEKYLKKVGYKLAFVDNVNGACIFWDEINNLCKIYDIRPTQCKTYPFWQHLVCDENKMEKEKAFCPGIGKGPLYNNKQIKQKLNANFSNTKK